MYIQESYTRKFQNFKEKYCYPVYCISLILEIITFIYYWAICIIQYNCRNNHTSWQDIYLKAFIISVYSIIMIFSLINSLHKDNIYFLFQFLIIQFIFNMSATIKFGAIVKGIPEFQQVLIRYEWISKLSIVFIVINALCFINFCLFSSAIYQKNKFKVFKRVGPNKQNNDMYKIYKNLKCLIHTYCQLFIVNTTSFYLYDNDWYEYTIDSLSLVLIIMFTYIVLQGIIQEAKMSIMFYIMLVFVIQSYKLSKIIYYYQKKQLDSQSIDLQLTTRMYLLLTEICNTIIAILIIIFGKAYLGIIGKGLRDILNPKVNQQQLQVKQNLINQNDI